MFARCLQTAARNKRVMQRAVPVAALQARHATAVPNVAPGLQDPTRKKVMIFNRTAKKIQRAKTANLSIDECKLHDHIAGIVMERLGYITREFPTVLELGCGRGILSKKYLEANPEGLQTYMQCDMSQEMLDSCYEETCKAVPKGVTLEQYNADEDNTLPFKKRSVDLIISMLSLHWVNDIEATLKQCRTLLKQDGVLLICVFGGKSLAELQSCFTVGEQERDGGVSPHINPFLTGPSMGDLLSNAGFNFPTVDIDRFTFFWKTTFHLMEYLQMIGESSCLHGRRRFVSKDVLLATAAIYDRLWAEEGKGIPATFEIIHAVGWSPHPSHAEPSARGSGSTLSLKDIAESLGEELMSEDSVGTELDKKKKLMKILKEHGVSNSRLKTLEDLMERRLMGDNSLELEEQIMAARNEIQSSFDKKDLADVQHNLPSAENTSYKKSITHIKNATVITPDQNYSERKVTEALERSSRLSNPGHPEK
eukprot:TRINITY_DN4652_c3_g1_i1.p1 TRINITY_DN4652_c3_g1~~TRINITY_DN4652_c3_g1_i1.p1  ORF type:complete len:480 (+),score=89.56 TRINITY_DN4652_c3_g1_i1:62-1501(+)